MTTNLNSMSRLLLALASFALVAPPAAQPDTVRYYHLDGIGNVRAVTNQAGVVVERHDYLPYGEECTIGPCASNPGAGAGQPRKFTGKERDTETGLDYFGARYYGSKIGRFTTVDPLYTWQENLVDPQRWNRYSYARNNPFRYVDPDGRGIVKHTVKLIAKGGDVASTFTGVIDDAAVLFSADPTVGTAARLLAAASLTSELLPVSGRDVKEGVELGSRLLRKANDAPEAAGVVYRRTDPKTGAEYVGRSKSDGAFLNRQRAHDSTLGTKHEFEIIDRAAPGTPLRASEESAIRAGGGPGRLANKRYEMNETAYKACGGTCEKPKP